MSKANRKKVYDRLVENKELWKDDGALVKEFGPGPTIQPKPKSKSKGDLKSLEK